MCVASFHSSEISSEGTLLARYEVPGGPREVVAYQEPSGIALFDHDPADPGRGLFIDRGFFATCSLEGLVLEYVAEGERLKHPPVSEGGLRAALEAPVIDRWGFPVEEVPEG